MKIARKCILAIVFTTIIFNLGCKKTDTVPFNLAVRNKILFTYIPYYGLAAYLGAIDRVDSLYGIWTVNNDGTGRQKINIVLSYNTFIDNLIAPKMSPDKKTILFNANNPTSHTIYSCNADGSNVKQLFADDGGYIYVICDTYTVQQQQKLLFIRYHLGSSINSYVVPEFGTANIDGSNVQNTNIVIPANYYFDTQYMYAQMPKISADGKTICFALKGADFNNYIYTANVDGSNVKPLPISSSPLQDGFAIGGIYTLQQTPQIVYIKSNNIPDAVFSNLNGLTLQDITLSIDGNNGGLLKSAPAKISRDGSKIFFNTSNKAIYSRNLDGSNATRVLAPTIYEVLLGDTY